MPEQVVIESPVMTLALAEHTRFLGSCEDGIGAASVTGHRWRETLKIHLDSAQRLGGRP